MKTHFATLLLGILLITTRGSLAQSNQSQSLTPNQAAEKLISNEGSIGGIGAKLEKTNGVLVVQRVFPASPAERAGLQPGCEIITINGIPTASMKLDDATKLVRGLVGSEVKLELQQPGGRRTETALVREKILLSPVEARRLEGDWLLVKLPFFDQETSAGLKAVLTRDENAKVRGIILDLRGTAVGSVQGMREVASAFLPQQSSLWFERRPGGVQEQRSPLPQVTSKPLVLLVNQTTQVAELLASAIQRNHRGTIIGQPTSGQSLKSGPGHLAQNPDGTSHFVQEGTFVFDPARNLDRVIPDRVLPDSATDDDFMKAARESLVNSGGHTDAKPDAATRLKKVKALFDQGLINKEDYDKKMKEIMDSL